ncbi:MAG: cytochrome P450 [Bacteroidota bacterium]|nr:cytochrome P450 [Bacteroidota bacterium]
METKKIPVAHKSGMLKTYKIFTKNPLQFLCEKATNDSGISQFNLLHYRIVHFTHPEFIRHVLTDSEGKYTQSRDRDHMKLLFGDGLLTSSGKHWQKQRNMIQPCFGMPQMEKLFAGITKQINNFPVPVGDKTDIHQFSLDLVNRIIAEVIFSDASDEILEIGNVLVTLKTDTLARLSDFALPLWMPTTRNSAFKKQRSFVCESIRKLIVARKASAQKPDDLLTFFLRAKDKQTGEVMSEKELTEELLGVYAAAHEPVAIALSYVFFLLANHPQHVELLGEELSHVLNGGEISMENFRGLVYNKQVVQETLRLYPPVWVSGKRALQDDVINGYRIKKNDNIIFSPLLIHRHPSFWKNPDEFDPDRFAPGKERNAFAYIPFSGGTKHCVGSHLAMMILQLVLAKTTAEVSMETTAKKIEINPFTTLKPLEQLSFRVSKRRKCCN